MQVLHIRAFKSCQMSRLVEVIKAHERCVLVAADKIRMDVSSIYNAIKVHNSKLVCIFGKLLFARALTYLILCPFCGGGNETRVDNGGAGKVIQVKMSRSELCLYLILLSRKQSSVPL